MTKQSYWLIITLTLLLIILGWQQPSQATEPPPADTDSPPAILGEPVQKTAVSQAPQPQIGQTETIARPTGSDPLYLPLILNQKLGPEAQAVVDLINAERAVAGCPPLAVNSKLVAAAQGHSEDMALNDFVSHTGSNGSSFVNRIEAQGYSWSRGGENIAAGYNTAASAVNGWMNSSGHRGNILNCSYQETGVGYYYLPNDTGSVNYGRYWTQVFASP